jgi:hypothetical protein
MDRAQFGPRRRFIHEDQINVMIPEIGKRIGDGGNCVNCQRFSKMCVQPCAGGSGERAFRSEQQNGSWFVVYHRSLGGSTVVGPVQPLSQHPLEILIRYRFAHEVVHA